MSVSNSDAKLGVWIFMLHGAAGVGVWLGEATKHPKVPERHALALRPA